MEDLLNEEKEAEFLPPGCVIPESVAVKEVKEFVDEILDDWIPTDKISTKYRRTIRAVMMGKIVLSDDPLVYTLRDPLNPDGQYPITQLTLKKRITAQEQQQLIKGLKDKADSIEYGLKCMSFIIGQPAGMLGKFSDRDRKFIEEISQLFT